MFAAFISKARPFLLLTGSEHNVHYHYMCVQCLVLSRRQEKGMCERVRKISCGRRAPVCWRYLTALFLPTSLCFCFCEESASTLHTTHQPSLPTNLPVSQPNNQRPENEPLQICGYVLSLLYTYNICCIFCAVSAATSCMHLRSEVYLTAFLSYQEVRLYQPWSERLCFIHQTKKFPVVKHIWHPG